MYRERGTSRKLYSDYFIFFFFFWAGEGGEDRTIKLEKHFKKIFYKE